MQDIQVAIPHQPSKAGMAGFARYFGADNLVETLTELGNCVAVSIPCTLYKAVRSGRVKRGDKVLLVGTGAGLSIAGAVLTY